MTSKYLFPSIDTDGWVNTATKTIDRMLAHFFLSEHSQTAHFPEEVHSFTWIIARYQNDMVETVKATQDSLQRYFSQAFDNVQVEVSSEAVSESINLYNLIVYVSVRGADGNEYNVARLIRYDGVKINAILAVINQ